MSERTDYSVGVLQVKSFAVERDQIHLQAGETLRVGRIPTNDIVLEDTLVSRFHAIFNASASGIVLSDLSSLNGTFLNGRRISTPVNLRPGDVITIGNTEITVHPGALEKSDGDVAAQNTIAAQMKGVVVTVLLADVCGYTKFSEQFSANDVATMLQLWFSHVSETVEEYGGEVDKYIGDCVMALWRGSQRDAHALASRAAQAALSILDRTNSLSGSGKWHYHDKNPWCCRISLNSGEALMGTLGGSKSRDFTVLGDTVNIAFRLNDLAGKVGQDIVLSADTVKLIDEHFVTETLGTTTVEGRSGTVEMFSLVRAK